MFISTIINYLFPSKSKQPERKKPMSCNHEVNPYKHQGRCAKCGRFMPSPSKVQKQTTFHQTQAVDKDKYINMFRNSTCSVSYRKHGTIFTRLLSLEPKYLGNYVGKGTYKKADDDAIFAYDIKEERFVKFRASGIISVVPVVD